MARLSEQLRDAEVRAQDAIGECTELKERLAVIARERERERQRREEAERAGEEVQVSLRSIAAEIAQLASIVGLPHASPTEVVQGAVEALAKA